MSSNASLLKEWELLRVLMGSLVETSEPQDPSAWALGPAEDAVALALAYNETVGGPGGGGLKVFLSGPACSPAAMHFPPADIRRLPAARRAAFVRDQHRWTPLPPVTRRVVLARPAAPVDLVTVRVDRRTGPPPELALLRRGGLVLFVDPSPPSPGAGFRPFGPSRRVFEKVTEAETAAATDVGAETAGPTLEARLREEEMVRTHLNLARSLARRFAHHGEMGDDLEQVALLALVKAAGRYDDDHGSSFATFATASILGELKRHFRDRTWMLRVPRSLQETYLAVKAAREDLGHQLGCSPTIAQIAGHLRISEETVLAAMEAGDSYWPASLDAGRGTTDDADVGIDVPVVEFGFDAALNRRRLRECLPLLDGQERYLVKRLYFDGWTQRRMADELGVSQMQVSRLLARTLSKLKRAFDEG